MSSKAGELVLKKSHAACLAALRQHKEAKAQIAIQARLALDKASKGLRELERLGLAQRDEMNRWRTTKRGRRCRFKVIPDRTRRNSATTGPGGRRLLALLDRPRRGDELAEMLGITSQRVHQLVVKLHAHGHVRLGDSERPLLIVSRTNDKTPLLLRNEERVLSAVPAEYVTSAKKIRLAAGLPEKQTQKIIEQFLASGFIEECAGLHGDPVYRVTAAGREHPQFSQSARRAQPPRLPVESDRVFTVLSAILDAGSMRINEARDTLKIPHDSIRALMQYLKRKALVQKTDQALLAPYELTDKGQEALAEMLRRRAA